MPAENLFRVGGVELRVDHRSFGDDGGPAVRVLAETDGQAIQLLRFDCFRKDPHYHYDPAGKDDKRDLNKDEVPDPIAWTVERLRNDLPEMIRTAGYPDVASRVDQGAVADVLAEVEDIMRDAG